MNKILMVRIDNIALPMLINKANPFTDLLTITPNNNRLLSFLLINS